MIESTLSLFQVCRGKAAIFRGCETHPASVAPAGSTGGATWIEPVHDDAGNMTEMPSPLAPTSSLLATYDAWNRMVVVANSGGTILTNEYDGNHHRIRKVVNGGDTFDYYYNHQWQLIVEAKNGSADSIYAWHAQYIDALAVRFRAADKHAFMHDANFNVTAAYDVTPGSGTYRTIVERYRYTPYGEVTILDADFSADADQISDIGNHHLYTGRERDSETGLQLNRYRWYHAPLGRWVSRDPVEYQGDGPNLYCAYFVPHGSDPSGLTIKPGTINDDIVPKLFECPESRKLLEEVRDAFEDDETFKGEELPPTFVIGPYPDLDMPVNASDVGMGVITIDPEATRCAAIETILGFVSKLIFDVCGLSAMLGE